MVFTETLNSAGSNRHLLGPVSLTPCCRVFNSGDVTTGFNKLDMSRPGFEPRSPACGSSSRSSSSNNTLSLLHAVEKRFMQLHTSNVLLIILLHLTHWNGNNINIYMHTFLMKKRCSSH